MKNCFKVMSITLLATMVVTTGVNAQDNEETNSKQDSTSTYPMPTKVETIEGQKRHFGLLAGASDPVEGDYKASAMTAIEVGYQPYIPYGLAFELLTEDFEAENTDTTLTRTQFSIKTSYNFGGDIPVIKYSYIGVGLGVATENQNDSSPTYGVLIPNLGFDIPLSALDDKLSLGVNFRYTSSASNEADASSLNGVVKYWF